MNGFRVPALALLMVLSLPPVQVSADSALFLGVSSGTRAAAGLGTCWSPGQAQVFYNPAALVSAGELTFGFGTVATVSSLTPAEEGSPGDPVLYLEGTLATPVPLGPLGKDRLFLGLAFLLPKDHIYDFTMPSSDRPVWLGRGSSVRNLSLAAGLGLRLPAGLSLGLGLTLVPDVRGDVSLNLVNPEGPNTLNVEVDPRFRPVVGLRWQAGEVLSLGLSWRGGSRVAIDLPVTADATSFDMDARVFGAPSWTPDVISLGGQVSLASFRLGLQADWLRSSEGVLTTSLVQLFDKSGQDTLQGSLPDPGFQDSLAIRSGLEWSWSGGSLSGGYGVRTSMVKEQTGTTNLLDALEHRISLGGRFKLLSGVEDGPASLSLTWDLQGLLTPEARNGKTEVLVGNPGYPSLEYEALVLVGGLGAIVEF